MLSVNGLYQIVLLLGNYLLRQKVSLWVEAVRANRQCMRIDSKAMATNYISTSS